MAGGTDPVPSEDAPPGIDVSRPHPARMYDYYLGGRDNFAADREVAELTLKRLPNARVTARANREFLYRTVSYLVKEGGIRQFLDIGTGLPSANNTHEVAQRIAPEARVAYVDNDPLVLTHAKALLRSAPAGRTAYVQADLRQPKEILASPEIRSVLDFSEPVALMLLAILPFIPDSDDPAGIVATLLDALPPGSFLVASQLTADFDPVGVRGAERAYAAGGVTVQSRTAEEFGQLAFANLDLVPPGVVLVTEWRPEGSGPRPLPREVNGYGAVGRKPR